MVDARLAMQRSMAAGSTASGLAVKRVCQSEGIQLQSEPQSKLPSSSTQPPATSDSTATATMSTTATTAAAAAAATTTSAKLSNPTMFTLSADPWNDYQVLEQIGKGAYGRVFSARARRGDQAEVAVKSVDLEENETVVELTAEVMREVETLRQCKHPHILIYLGSYCHANQLWLVTELCAAGSILDLIKSVPCSCACVCVRVHACVCVRGRAWACVGVRAWACA